LRPTLVVESRSSRGFDFSLWSAHPYIPSLTSLHQIIDVFKSGTCSMLRVSDFFHLFVLSLSLSPALVIVWPIFIGAGLPPCIGFSTFSNLLYAQCFASWVSPIFSPYFFLSTRCCRCTITPLHLSLAISFVPTVYPPLSLSPPYFFCFSLSFPSLFSFAILFSTLSFTLLNK
jgi:hypothetical protein